MQWTIRSLNTNLSNHLESLYINIWIPLTKRVVANSLNQHFVIPFTSACLSIGAHETSIKRIDSKYFNWSIVIQVMILVIIISEIHRRPHRCEISRQSLFNFVCFNKSTQLEENLIRGWFGIPAFGASVNKYSRTRRWKLAMTCRSVWWIKNN